MSAPASWYPDPDPAGAGLRWWDGEAWTAHTAAMPPEGVGEAGEAWAEEDPEGENLTLQPGGTWGVEAGTGWGPPSRWDGVERRQYPRDASGKPLRGPRKG